MRFRYNECFLDVSSIIDEHRFGPMSLEGKIRRFSKLLKDNLTASTSGLNRVSPIFANHDIEFGKLSIYYYDMLGAEFKVLSFTAKGAGAGYIREVLERENQWTPKPLAERCAGDAVVIACCRPDRQQTGK